MGGPHHHIQDLLVLLYAADIALNDVGSIVGVVAPRI